MTIKLLTNYGPYLAGDLLKTDPNTEAGLVKLGMATADTTGGVTNVSQVLEPLVGGKAGSLPWHAVLAGRLLGAADDQQYLGAYSTMTLTVPSGLSPRPTVNLRAPAAGQLTVTGNVNGSTQSVVLTGSPTDQIGWCLCANTASEGYTLLRNH